MATKAARAAGQQGDGGLAILSGRVLFGLSSLFLSGAALWWNPLGKPWGPGASATMAYALFALHVALVFRRVSPMDPLIWTPFALLLFYFGEPVVIEWMGATSAGGYDPWEGGNALYVDRGFAGSVLSVAAFLWGIHLAGVRPLAGDPRRDLARDHSFGVTALFFTLGALAMVALGIAIAGPRVVFGLYGDWWTAKMAGADQRWIDMGMVFAEAGVFALLASDEPRIPWRRWLAYLVAPVLAFIAIQKGDRTGLIALGVGAGWCYTQRIGRLRWPTVLAAAFVALLVMPVISEWRAQRSLEVSKQLSVYELLGSSLYNMGSSVNALVYTMELIPREKPYSWGSTYVNAVVQAIPNIGLTKGKEFARSDLEDTPSNWITYVINPVWYANGGGYGYSMAGEWYYNFGTAGLVFGMALCGFGMTRARNKARTSSLALVWSATLFAGMVIWVRNIVGYALKVATWPIIGLWVVQHLVRLLRGRARGRIAAAPAATDPLTP